MVDEVDLLDANLCFAHIRLPDGPTSTVLTSNLALCPKTTVIEPSSELTNDLPVTSKTAEVENAQKPLEHGALNFYSLIYPLTNFKTC